MHVAPFLSREGRPLLLAITRGHYLVVAAEVQALRGVRGDEGNRQGYRSSILLPRASTGEIPFLEFQSESTRRRLFGRGVHRAPWRVTDDTAGGALVAIDHRHRLVAEMAVPADTAEETVQRELEVILEAAEAAEAEAAQQPRPAHPPASGVEEWRDDPDDGEGWKR